MTAAFEAGSEEGIKIATRFRWDLARNLERAAKQVSSLPPPSTAAGLSDDAAESAARMRARLAAMGADKKPSAPALSHEEWMSRQSAAQATSDEAARRRLARKAAQKARAEASRRNLEITRINPVTR